MVRLFCVENGTSIHLTFQEVIEFLPEAYFEIFHMSLIKFIELTLRYDPIFKIQSIPKNQVHGSNG